MSPLKKVCNENYGWDDRNVRLWLLVSAQKQNKTKKTAQNKILILLPGYFIHWLLVKEV